MICRLSLDSLAFAVLCWGIQARWESGMTDLLEEPQVKSFFDMQRQQTSGTEQSITPRQSQAHEEAMNFPLEPTHIQRELHTWCWNRYLAFVPPPL